MKELTLGGDFRPECRLPATNVQERFLFVERAGGHENDATVSFAWRLRGPISETAVDSALRTIIGRHEILRTRLVLTEAGTGQEVLSEAPFHLARVDLRAVPPADRIERVHAIERDTAAEAMDPTRPGLFRATLVTLGGDEAVLLGVAHHCVFDGQSTAILARELAELLAADAEGRAPELPALRLQYGDFALWQRDLLASDAFGAAEAFWRRTLAGAPMSALAPDHPAAGRRRADTVRRSLGPDFGIRAEALARRLEVSHFALGLAAVASVLGDVGGGDDLVIGTQASMRTDPVLAPRVGVFINTLPVRIALARPEPFAALVRRTHAALAEALEHAALPFDRILRAAGTAHPAGHSGPALVNFDFRGAFVDHLRVGSVTIEWFPSRLRERVHDFSISILGGPEGWELGIDYNAALYEEARVEAIAQALEARLSAILGDPGALLARPPEARAETLAEGTDGARMAALWAGVLGRPPRTPDDDFFDLGGYSLLLLRLAMAIEGEFGIPVEVPALLARPTPAGMLAAIYKARAEAGPEARTSPAGWWRAEALREGAPGGPVLLVVNQLFLFRRIAARIDERVTVTSLSLDLSSDHPAGTGADIHALAADAAALVCARHGGRVLGLCGHCIDGLMAMHVAAALGEDDVALTAMIDTWALEALTARSPAARLAWSWSERLGRWRHHLGRFRKGQGGWTELAAQIGPLGLGFRALGLLPPTEPEVERLRAVNRHLVALAEGTCAPPARGDIVLVATGMSRVEAARSLLGWQGKVPPGTAVVPVPGWHEEALIDTGADDIAAVLGRRLLSAARGPGDGGGG